jgi:hypothetical protein
MRKLVLFVMAVSVPGFSGDAEFNGRWNIRVVEEWRNRAWWLEVAGAGTPNLKGWFVGAPGGGLDEIPEISLLGGELRFAFNREFRVAPGAPPEKRKGVWKARLSGGRLEGQFFLEGASAPPQRWTGRRAPSIADKDDGTWVEGKPVPLFNGKDLAGWLPMIAGRELGWVIEDGLMKNVAGANNLMSKDRFWNFRLRAVYRVGKGSNSGIGLRGRYEVQILQDSNRPPGKHGHGAIYSRIAPLENATRPPGEFQELEVTLIGRQVTVILNGRKIIDRREIEGLTAMAHDPNEAEPGPISLQGDHGPVEFRSLVVTPLVRRDDPGRGKKIAIRGTYADPKPFWKTGARLDDYGINAIFVGSYSLSPELMARAKGEGAAVYVEFPTLNGKGYVEKHPEAWPIDEKGKPSPQATWFLGVCPTEPGFRSHRMRELRAVLAKYDVAGVWLDYFHWHAQFEGPRPILPETCFSKTCLDAFTTASGITLPEGSTEDKARWILSKHDKAWRDWRCSVLTDWVREARKVIAETRPAATLGVYHCPWTDEEFGGARRRILGLDLKALAREVDAFSPMVYHGRMGRRPEWVGEYVAWTSKSLGLEAGRRPHLWPIVQATDEPGVVSEQEFQKVVLLGASSASTGVMMFTFGGVADNDAKLAALRRLYLEWGRQ